MTAAISPAHTASIPPTFATVLSHNSTAADDAQVEAPFEEPPPQQVTSNIRHGSPSPEPPSLSEHHAAILSRIRTPATPFISIYDLPAPDLTPRFVFKVDEPSGDDKPHMSMPDGEFDLSPHPERPVKARSGSSPRIYFGDSAITFVPPFSYEFLERDPSVKAVPKNYRAWMRTGRPKLDVEGLERADAKSDFLAMGLLYPRDSESEGSGDENEKERKRKRKRRIAARALMAPIERPRRMAKKIAGPSMVKKISGPSMVKKISGPSMVKKVSGPSMVKKIAGPSMVKKLARSSMAANQLLSIKPVPRERPKREKYRSVAAVPIVDDKMRGVAPKPVETSDSSERPTSSMPQERPKKQKRRSVAAVPIVDDKMGGVAPKPVETSDSSERRSSSTLLDTDGVGSKSKQKRPNPDQEPKDVPPPKKQRVSRPMHVRKESIPQERKASPGGEPSVHTQSPLSELTPTPEPRTPTDIVKPTIRQNILLLRPGSDNTWIETLRPVPTVANSSQATQPLASPPGHRVNRKYTAIQPQPNSSQAAQPLASRPGHRVNRNIAIQPQPNSSQATRPLTSRPGRRVNRDPTTIQSQPIEMRTFPASIPIIDGFTGLYRRYPLITHFQQDDPLGKHVIPDDSLSKRAIVGDWNNPRDPRDLYTPRYTRGSGNKKMALCPICYEEPARGGEGRQEWNHTKTSQHNYHMQYYHGISPTRCAPFSPPIARRTLSVPRPIANERVTIIQGKCHNCKHWIAIEGTKVGELKVKELFWWKHAASCHKESTLSGESDIFIEDDAYRRLQEYETIKGRQS